MEVDKFNSEVSTLQKFFQIYCKNNQHKNIKTFNINLTYKTNTFTYDLELCEECYKTINYSFDRLKECTYDIKPKCRTCSTPCYEKPERKELAKIMKYSGMRLGLTKLKSRFKNIFSK